MDSRLVTNPQAFVERQSKYPGIRTQSLIVLCVGLAFALQHLGNVFLLDEAYERVSAPIWVLTVTDLAVPFLIWGAVTVAIYVVARLFEGYFPPGLLFRLTGWGMAPLIGAGLVRNAGLLYALRDATPPAELSFSGFQRSYEVYQTYMDGATTDPALAIGVLLAVPFVLYSGHIWATVVEHISDVTRRESYYVAAIPTALCLLWVASPYLL
ncbi:YIP1 family protein [Halosolutus gelatinilyticus]|uniref:YIP1 family protein n=1 Tax=Halosolutus gelatinilyticus TaxID=2931975 RepID=UPI001FF4DE39|nr:YIP1 family protein [Halosolutus gelatinilyticus]